MANTNKSPFSFGAPATSGSSNTGVLGTSSTPAKSVFGSGAAGGGLFGASNTSTPGALFGQTNTTATTTAGGLFGAAAAPSGGFKFNNTSATPSGGIFGQQPATTTSASPAGAQSTTATASSLFGGTTATPSLFGGNTTPSTSGFGSNTATTSAPSAFSSDTTSTAPKSSSNAPSFLSNPSTSANLFGAKPATPSPLSNTTATTAPSLFGANTTAEAPAMPVDPNSVFANGTRFPTPTPGGLFQNLNQTAGTNTPQAKPLSASFTPSGKPATTGLFGAQPTAGGSKSLFGEVSNTDKGKVDLFGKPAGTQAPASTATDLFKKPEIASGANPAPVSNLFAGIGQASSSAPAPGLFSAATTSAPTSGLFGAATTSAPSSGLFGAAATATTAPSSGLFGAAATSAPSSNLFGAVTTSAPASGGLFNAATTSAPPSGGLFNATTTSAPLAGGSTSTAPPSTGGLFGAASSSAPSTSLFSAPASTQPTTTATSGPALGASLFNSAPVSQPAANTAAPAASLFGASTGNAPATSTLQQQPSSRLASKSMDEIITTWSTSLAAHQKTFASVADRVAKWDRQLVQNSSAIGNLYSRVFQAERDTSEVERQLSSVERGQQEIEAKLERYEAEIESMLEAAGLSDEAATSGVDAERERTYHAAQDCQVRLSDMGQSLTSMIEEINSASGKLSQHKKADASEDPLQQIVRVLNSHLTQLQVVEKDIKILDTKVVQAQKDVGVAAGMNGLGGGRQWVEGFGRSYLGRR